MKEDLTKLVSLWRAGANSSRLVVRRNEAGEVSDGYLYVAQCRVRSEVLDTCAREVESALALSTDLDLEVERLRKENAEAFASLRNIGSSPMGELQAQVRSWQDAHEQRVEDRRALRSALEAVGQILSSNGCECNCLCDSDGHDDDCERCLACRIDKIVVAALRDK